MALPGGLACHLHTAQCKTWCRALPFFLYLKQPNATSTFPTRMRMLFSSPLAHPSPHSASPLTSDLFSAQLIQAIFPPPPIPQGHGARERPLSMLLGIAVSTSITLEFTIFFMRGGSPTILGSCERQQKEKHREWRDINGCLGCKALK